MRVLIPEFSSHVQRKRLTDLSEHLGLPLVTFESLLPNEIIKKTGLDNWLRPGIRRGPLIPDDTVLALIRKRITEPDAQNGWILTGFPQHTGQAILLHTMLLELGQLYDCTLEFKHDDRSGLPCFLAPYSDCLPTQKVQKTPLAKFYDQLNLLITISSNLSLRGIDNILQTSAGLST